MKLLILGDIHGEWRSANKLIKRAIKRYPDITAIIQLGDLGDHWVKGRYRYSRWNVEQATNLPVHWLDGNHDNHAELLQNGMTPNPYLIYQPRGSVLKIDGYRMMFMGGATSPDKDWRIAAMNKGHGPIWWPEESITRAQFDAAMQVDGPINAIFSHERPDCFHTSFADNPINVGKSDRIALEGIWEHFRPPFWFFGHYHKPEDGVHEGTRWVQCPVVEPTSMPRWTIWDGHAVELSWKKNCTRPNDGA